jgi:hypothetical protein
MLIFSLVHHYVFSYHQFAKMAGAAGMHADVC